MDLAQVREILDEIKYKNWHFEVGEIGDNMYLQVQWDEKCNFTGRMESQHGRKWLLSQHMVKNEIIQTALKAVLTAEEHEAREKFFYRGELIFGPHYDADALWELAHDRKLDYRKTKKAA